MPRFSGVTGYLRQLFLKPFFSPEVSAATQESRKSSHVWALSISVQEHSKWICISELLNASHAEPSLWLPSPPTAFSVVPFLMLVQKILLRFTAGQKDEEEEKRKSHDGCCRILTSPCLCGDKKSCWMLYFFFLLFLHFPSVITTPNFSLVMFLFKMLFRIGFTDAQELFHKYQLYFLFKQQMLHQPATSGEVALLPM